MIQRVKIFCQRGNDAFPLSALQAAVLLPQLDDLAADNRRRYDAVDYLFDQCEHLRLLRPVRTRGEHNRPSYYKVAWYLQPPFDTPARRAQFVAAVRAEGIALGEGFPGFVRRGPRRCRRTGPLEQCRRAAETLVVLHHPVLLAGNDRLRNVARALAKVGAALERS